jgi:hypothetical protein
MAAAKVSNSIGPAAPPNEIAADKSGAKSRTAWNAKETRAPRRAFSPWAQQITALAAKEKEKPPGGN